MSENPTNRTASRQPASPMVVASALVAQGSCVRERTLVTTGDVLCSVSCGRIQVVGHCQGGGLGAGRALKGATVRDDTQCVPVATQSCAVDSRVGVWLLATPALAIGVPNGP